MEILTDKIDDFTCKARNEDGLITNFNIRGKL